MRAHLQFSQNFLHSRFKWVVATFIVCVGWLCSGDNALFETFFKKGCFLRFILAVIVELSSIGFFKQEFLINNAEKIKGEERSNAKC